MRSALSCALALAVTLAAAPARAELVVSLHDGRITINATDVTVRQILAEWARVGQAKIVNGDGVPGGPVTLQLVDVPEQQALDILLRATAGYLAAPRALPLAGASHFDRVVIMPTSAPSRTAAPPPPPQPRFQAFDQDDDEPRNGPPPAPPLAQQIQQAQQQLQQAQQQQFQQPVQTPAQPFQREPGVTTYPPAVVPNDGAAPPPFAAPTPGVPVGVAVPGMVVPAPQPGQPGQPIAPGR
jgi:hypothetical protein